MRNRLLVLAALAVAVCAPPVSAHHPHSASKDYTGSWDPLSPRTCEQNEQLGMNVGGACFDIPHPTTTRATIEVVDTVNSQPGFFYRFLNAEGLCATPSSDGLGCDSAGLGCPSVTGVAVPGNSVELEVLPSGVVLGPLTCFGTGQTSPGASTMGTITVTFLA